MASLPLYSPDQPVIEAATSLLSDLAQDSAANCAAMAAAGAIPPLIQLLGRGGEIIC